MFQTNGPGMIRREFLQVGFSGYLGLGLPNLLAGRARADAPSPSPRAKSMILVFLTGGLGHLDSFDMKPDAPEGIRGEFKPIDTSAAGVRYCEHLPGMARHADLLAVVRSMSHAHTNHLNATHQLLTGHPQPGAFFDKVASRDDYPNYASALDYIRPRGDGVPSGVLLPTYLMEGPLTWPGQHAGFLGPKFDPLQIRQDPNKPDFRDESLSPPAGFSVETMNRRRSLLDELAATRDQLAESVSGKDPMSEQRELAYNLLLSGKVARAFEMDREPAEVRDRYGRHMFGQSLLLARRLVQAGVPIVQANMGRVQNWDTHSGNFKRLKNDLLPPLDRGVSALLDDLKSLGMLDETLVVLAGEFGRTPRIGASTGNANGPDGRDHWSKAFSVALAGAGVQGGQVIGQTDRIGAYPSTRPYAPADLASTIYRALGIDPTTELRDRFNRPIQLCIGEEIAGLYSGSVA
ncbi:DUF1501 domain-containing protein [Tundrisphaera sp. TA3]|uniref:DUF1501 domain-containing protein n=1 Tax=Tundrisphaera sp. TA3 TaxID=3435775 RepID=UPI003EBBD914